MRKTYTFLPKTWFRTALAIVAVISFAKSLSAQTSPPKIWDRTLGGSMAELNTVMQQTSDGGFILGGFSDSPISGEKSQNSKGQEDFWVVKTDINGNKVWDKTIGGNKIDRLWTIKQTKDGGYILGGSSDSNVSGDKSQASKGGNDYWLVKLDANGAKQWDKTYGGSGQDDLNSIQQTSDGGYILGGLSLSPASGDKTEASKGGSDFWVVKLDASGALQWEQTYGGSGNEYFDSIEQTKDGGYAAAGVSTSGISGDKTQAANGGNDIWFLKLDATGNKTWDKSYGGSQHDNLGAMRQTTDGGYVLGGDSNSNISGDKSQNSKGGYDLWIIKIDANGIKTWDKTYGGSLGDAGYSIIQTIEGGYIIGGWSSSGVSGDKTQPNLGYDDVWVVRLSPNGSKLWDKTVGASSSESMRCMAQASDGGYILGVSSTSNIGNDKTQNARGGLDYWLVKIASGCMDLTASLTSDCNNNGTNVNLNVVGIQNNASGTPSWALTYTINGVSQTVTGTTPNISLAQNVAPGTIISLVSISSGSCTTNLNTSITVQPIPTAPNAAPVSRCGPGTVTLTATGAPAGGTYLWYATATGGTVINSNNTGSFVTPNINSTTTFYVASVYNNGCEGPRTPVTATIIPLPVIDTGTGQIICVMSAPVQLTGFSPAGGVWSGPGVNATGLFTPSASLTGIQTLTYTVTQNGCTASAPLTINVTQRPNVNPGSAQTICAIAAPFQLSGFSPAGGTWSGPGVSPSGLFTPSTSLIGAQTLKYTLSRYGCVDSATKVITVSQPPVVNAGPNSTICANAAPVQFTGFSPAGGSWSGPGVSFTGLFTPTPSLVGTQTYTYSYYSNSCTVKSTKQITITPIPAQPTITLIAPDTLISSITGNSYEWTFNNTALPGNTRKMKATATGAYAVRVKDGNNCASAYSTQYNYLVSGLRDNLTDQINLFPNPSTGIVNLSLKGQQVVQVTVFNSLGQVVLSKTVLNNGQNQAVPLNLSREAKGIYLIKAWAGKQAAAWKIIIE